MVNQRRLAAEWLGLLIGGVLLAVFLVHRDVTRRIDFSMLDFAASLTTQEPADDIAIVAIDERSLASVGEWPWSRATHARLIDNLRKAGAKIVLYDVLFVEPGDPADDALLAAAIAQHGKVVLPFSFVPTLNQAEGTEPSYPLPALVDAAAALGHIQVTPDDDGAVRRFALGLQIDGQSYRHFVPAALALADPGITIMNTAPGGRWPIVPFRPANSYPVIPADAVLNATVPPELVAGRIILIGATAQGMGDNHPVPSRHISLMSGVETQANLLDSLRSNALIHELPRSMAAALAGIALVAQFLAFWKFSPRSGLGVSLAVLGLTAGFATALVPLAHVWIPPGTALLVVVLAYPLWSWRRLTIVSGYLQLEAERLMAATGETTIPAGFDMVARQVNRLRQLVGEVSDALEFVRSAIEASPDAILVVDANNSVLLANQAASHLFNETPDPIGQSLADLYINQSLCIDRTNTEIALPDGRAFLFASATLAGKLMEGEGNRIIAFRDITEIRRTQRENEELFQFLSHDMRSPQVAILALTQELGADKRQLAEQIRSQAQLTLGLADGFVQLARVQETSPNFADHDLSFLIEETIDQIHTLAVRKNITLQRDIPADPIFAEVDPAQIARMASNLIGNAVKYTQEGGLISISLALVSTDEVQITVADNGPGLPPERLNDPFMRFGTRSNAGGPSAGLGLAFVKRVVDAHHGRIDMQSGPKTGTIFEITLPLEQSEPG